MAKIARLGLNAVVNGCCFRPGQAPDRLVFRRSVGLARVMDRAELAKKSRTTVGLAYDGRHTSGLGAKVTTVMPVGRMAMAAEGDVTFDILQLSGNDRCMDAMREHDGQLKQDTRETCVSFFAHRCFRSSQGNLRFPSTVRLVLHAPAPACALWPLVRPGRRRLPRLDVSLSSTRCAR